MDIVFLVLFAFLLEAIIKCVGHYVISYKDKQIECLRLKIELGKQAVSKDFCAD